MSKDEAKNALQKNAAPVDGVNAIDDNDLEKVAGGWTNIFNCPQEYNFVLCELTRCPHRICKDNVPDENHYEMRCDQGFWTINRKYQYGAYAGHEQ